MMPFLRFLSSKEVCTIDAACDSTERSGRAEEYVRISKWAGCALLLSETLGICEAYYSLREPVNLINPDDGYESMLG